LVENGQDALVATYDWAIYSPDGKMQGFRSYQEPTGSITSLGEVNMEDKGKRAKKQLNMNPDRVQALSLCADPG
jgi:hypothetical protein